jgi:hypothetical protein
MPLDPVFLSASVPDPNRNPKYFKTGNAPAIRDAVIALVTNVVPRTRLVFGGHPAITPMVKWIADQLNAFNQVRMFQSKFFRDSYLPDLQLFRYIETEVVTDEFGKNDREKSLLAMRQQMIGSETFSAAFFIGGMEGVEEEYELIKSMKPSVPRFPVYTTGGAARLLWTRESEAVPRNRQARLIALREKTSYTSLFTSLLEKEKD